MAILTGSAGLAGEDRAEALAILAFDKEDAIAHRAAESLLACRLDDFVAALRRPGAPLQLFRYCADQLAEKHGVADAMAENADCPAEYLIQVAPHLKEAVNALVEDLDRLTSTPGLVTALAPCAGLSPRSRQTLQEIQKNQPLDQGELVRNVESLSSFEPDRQKRLHLYQRVSRMSVVERIQLALKGNREERMLLIRDPSKLVQRAVLQSAKLSEQEVEQFAAMTSLTEEVLRNIAGNRQYIKNYSIMRALTFNPKVPIDVTLQFMPRLLVTDLKNLCVNRNVPDTLRTAAQKLHLQRTKAKPGPTQ